MLSDIVRGFVVRATDRQLKLAGLILDELLEVPMVDICIENGFSLRESLRYIVNQLEIREKEDPSERVFRNFIEVMLEHTAEKFE
jgi:hypothetical protein